MKDQRRTKVISILNQKGGVGKTTLVSNLGVAISKAGKSVLLVDSDPQGSLRDWNNANNGKILSVIGLDRETLANDLQAVKENHDIIIIDGAPQSAKLASAAVKSADIIIIPVTPSPYDVWACSDLVDIIKARHELTEGSPPSFFVVSRARKNTKLSGELTKALEDYGLKVLKGKTIHRETYAQTASEGKTVHHDKNARDATNEINLISNEILEILKNA